MTRAGLWSLCVAVLLAALAGVLAEGEKASKAESAAEEDDFGHKTLAKYPLSSGGHMRVLELPHGARAIAFGNYDFQTLSSQHSVENDADFTDIGK